jgi:hypothetical protein
VVHLAVNMVDGWKLERRKGPVNLWPIPFGSRLVGTNVCLVDFLAKIREKVWTAIDK